MFLNKNYLITNEYGVEIYQAIKDLPIIDAHNHADVKSLAANCNFKDLWELFAATDHYVWEVMRKCDVTEEFVTGSASNHDKFIKLSEIFDDIIGNPCYEWIHLDLKFLGINELLNAENGEVIWQKGLEILAKDENKPLEILKRLNVKTMCSTDDPLDYLDNHKKINELLDGEVSVRPTWRPDRAMKIFAPTFAEYIRSLGERYNTNIQNIDDLLNVMQQSHDYFATFDCVASDHGVESALSGVGNKDMANKALIKSLANESLSNEEIDNYMNYMIGEFAEMNAKSDWVTQLHMGAVRDVRTTLFNSLGADVGGDICSLAQDYMPNLVKFLNRFDNRLKVVLYSLDPAQHPTLATLSRAFGNKVRLGSAWWLLDTPIGMHRQLEYIGSVDLLSQFAGMVSDSRKLLSYGSRFEMFRRILANCLGEMVKKGQMPQDLAIKLAIKMSYDKPKEFFNC